VAACVAAIERDSHNPLTPEGTAVFADRLAGFQEGCCVVGPGCTVEGDALAHPWRVGIVSALGLTHIALPPELDCLWPHDVTLRPTSAGAT